MKIINISNRLPVSFTRNGEELTMKASSGGLVSAVESLGNEQHELHWVGVADFPRIDWLKGEQQYKGKFKLHPVYIDSNLYSEYYNGFSNSVLWPLFHYFPSFVEYQKSFFEAYLEVNKQIAEQIQFMVGPKDIVWIHDYHLIPLVSYLRKLVPQAKVGFFLHIPFPSYELIRILPKECRDAIVTSLLGADLIGFHTYDYVQHFATTVQMVAGVQHKNFQLQYEGRIVKMSAYPISIDFTKFYNAFDNSEVEKERNKIRDLYEGKRIIFSVDRLDYTKGIIYRLKGYAQFLETHPEYKEKVVFVLVAVPSRDTISKYKERKELIENLIGQFNGKHGNYKWAPIIYQYGSVDFTQLMGLYTSCDIAFISPIRDGMNLVAKEFVASRKDGKGVLLLSDMTGAAKELTDALLFNPLDEIEISQTIEEAMVMSEEEQGSRLERMQKQISRNDVFRWSNNFIGEMERIKRSTLSKSLMPMDQISILGSYDRAQKRLIVLDYDGTLTELKPLPEQAYPDQRLQTLIKELCSKSKNHVIIISGRKKEILDEWFGSLPVTIVAEHGVYAKTDQWYDLLAESTPWKPEVMKIMEQFTENCPFSFVEEKNYSLAWHYRNSDPESGFAQSRELINLLSDYLISTNVNILDGHKVVEVKPIQANKGEALKRIIDFMKYDFVMGIGDDKTDEDMFDVINHWNGISIKVGKGYSIAQYRMENVTQNLSLLTQFK